MASTYVNDLRLNEMATGDQSGSWGTVTNTNLELIGEAFSYGTEAITTNADTHTTTIADGASDPGRAMFLKYTGALDSACTITIGPNTVSKMWFIENATSGSQNIIISQGSGANVTIAAGQTKAVYSDGAGAGAAFVDAFAALNVAGVSPTELAILDGITATTAELNYNDITTLGTVQASKTVTANANGDVSFPNSDKVMFGSGNPFQIYYNGSDSIINETAGGNLLVQGDNIYLQNGGGSASYLRGVSGGAIDLRFAGNVKLATTTSGIDVTGTVTMDGGSTSADFTFGDNAKANFGTSGDLRIYHDGTHSYIEDVGTGNLDIRTNGARVYIGKTGGETAARFDTDGPVILYYDNSQKLETVSSGVEITGTLQADGVTVDGTLDIEEVYEFVNTGTSTTGTITADTTAQGILYFTSAQAANRTINFTNVGANLSTGQSVTCSVLITNGSTAYYLNAYQVDGGAVTPKWSGGSAPTSGNANGIDVYTFTIIRTGASTYTVLASQTQFA